jgi:hypothetical protein
MTKTQTATINAINAAFGNPTTISRAEIASLVFTGEIKWPYFITDHKHGFVASRGVFNVPSVEVGKSKYVAMGVTVTPITIPGKYFNAANALKVFVSMRKKAKKSFKNAEVVLASEVPAVEIAPELVAEAI